MWRSCPSMVDSVYIIMFWKSIVIYLYLPFIKLAPLMCSQWKTEFEKNAFHRHHGKFGGTLLSSFLLALPDCSLPGQLAYSSVGHCCAPFAFAINSWKLNGLPLKRDTSQMESTLSSIIFQGRHVDFQGGMWQYVFFEFVCLWWCMEFSCKTTSRY